VLRKIFSLFALAILLSGCSQKVTLYRGSTVVENARYRIATFDGTDLDVAGNRENCQIAAKLFMAQPGTKNKFWCEG
jgi:hypothetical protein